MQLINQTDSTKNLRFVCFAKTSNPSLHNEINFIAADIESEETYWYNISLKKAFLRSSFSDYTSWNHKVQALGKNMKEF